MKELSYSGKMIQTTRFRLRDQAWLAENLRATREFLSTLGTPGQDESGVPMWTGVDAETVAAFLSDYLTVQDRTSFDADVAASYVRRQLEQTPPELTTWTVAIAARRELVERLGTVDLHVQDLPAVSAIERTRLKVDTSSIGVLTNPGRSTGPIRTGDEEIGLTDQQILQARHAKADGEYERIRDALLAQRGQAHGLLVVYPISRLSIPRGHESDTRLPLFEKPADSGRTVIGLAIGFPPSDSAATIEYITGSVGAGDDE